MVLTLISDWNAPSITCLFLLLEIEGTHYADDGSRRLRDVEHYKSVFSVSLKPMLAIRLYISALTILFLVLVTASRGVGILEAVVVTCTVLYLILDVRTDLRDLRNELKLLKELEKHVSILLR